MWYYYDENNNVHATFPLCGGEVVYAGNGLFLHIINDIVYYEKCDVEMIEWMYKHNCLNSETRKLVYGC